MIGSQRKRHVAAIQAAAAGTPTNQAVTDNFSGLDRFGVWVTDRVGTMTFFLVIFAWTVGWVGYNVLASKVPSLHWHAFDPFPAFVAYLLISNVIQISLMPLLMVGQNMQGRHSEARAEADYLVNQKAFADTEAILTRLQALDERLLEVVQTNQKILRHLADEADGQRDRSRRGAAGPTAREAAGTRVGRAAASRQRAHVLLPAGVEVVPAHAEAAPDGVADALGAEVGVGHGDDERLHLVEAPAVRHVEDHGAGLQVAQTDLLGGVALPQVLRARWLRAAATAGCPRRPPP